MDDTDVVLEHFDLADAWALGSDITQRALDAGHPVVIDIRRPGDVVLFHAALPGSAPDQHVWAERKARVALRMEASSAADDERLSQANVDPVAIGWLDHSYAVTGGAVPVRVRGVGVVAAVTASGLSSQEDHDLVLDGLKRMADAQKA